MLRAFFVFVIGFASLSHARTPKCERLFREARDFIATSNFCKADEDCELLDLSGRQAEFGCHHFVHRKANRKRIYAKLAEYHKFCTTVVVDCPAPPQAKCEKQKCVVSTRSSNRS